MGVIIKESEVNPVGIVHSLGFDYSMTDGERYISPTNLMNKYAVDKERMDEIAERIANRQPIKEWSAIYWIAVAIGHILEWVVKHEHSNVANGSDNGTTDSSKGE